MGRSEWERWAPLSGLAFALFFLTGLVLLAFDAVDEKSDAEIVSYFADSANRDAHILGVLLMAIGIGFLLLFAATLRQRLLAAERGEGVLPTVAALAGGTAAALWLGSGAAMSATAFVSEDLTEFVVDPNTVRLMLYLGFIGLVGAMLMMCVGIAATSVLALRTDVLPTWVGWLGLGAIVLAIAESFLLPVFTAPVWSAIVGIVLFARGSEVGASAREPGALSRAG